MHSTVWGMYNHVDDINFVKFIYRMNDAIMDDLAKQL